MICNQRFKPNLFISLGEDCLSAGILEYLNLRNESFLFDWASCEKFSIVKNILDNGLEEHIDKNITNNFNMDPGHDDYIGKHAAPRDQIIYPHLLSHGHDKKYQIKCATRFFNEMNRTSNRILFVFSYGRNFGNVSIEQLQELVGSISKYGLEQFLLVALEYKGNGSEIDKTFESERLLKYEYKTPSPPPWHLQESDKPKWDFFTKFFEDEIL